MKVFIRMMPSRLLVVLGALTVFWISHISLAHGGPLNASQIAPDFSLPDLSGKMVNLQDFKGHLVLVDFWATWCIPCRKSLPELAALEKKYRDQGMVVLGLAVDNPDSFDNQYIKDFLKKYDADYTILRADQTVIDQYLGRAEPNVPTLFIIDGEGHIIKTIEGYTEGQLAPILERLTQKHG